MRSTILAALGLLVGVAGYMYATNPAGCKEILSDALSLFISVSPVHVTSGGGTPIADLTRSELVTADGSTFNFPDSTPPMPIQYYALYYGSGSDEASRAFTPTLVDWYKKFKPDHRDFEVIYISSDPDKSSMLDYMRSTGMPWPAFRFEDLKHDHQGIDKFSGSAIPDLVLVDSDGKVLSDTFTWSGSSLGPQHVLDDIGSIVKKTPPPPPPPKVLEAGTVNLALPPIKFWAPPEPFPAQPNWTWTALDGTSYQNVVVTDIAADTVTITHSLGVGHIPISNLPPDLQKLLNYDPDAAGSAGLTPFDPSQIREAQTAARTFHRPLAWIATQPDYASNINADQDSWANLTQMALNHIKPEAVIILLDDPTKVDSAPPAVRDQINLPDDGPLPPGHHFAPPKIVFSTPDYTQIYGRVSSTLLKANREKSIDSALSATAAKALAAATAEANSAPVPIAPAIVPPKAWIPPAVMPSQPNWTWTTSDGTTYQDVVVTKIEPETVSITHSMGVAHLPIANLPPDIQKLLNYDPIAAAAARAETAREETHPYYKFSSLAEAQNVARQLHWPLAWICGFLPALSVASPQPDSGDDLTQMAVNHLKSRAVIIFLDGDGDLPALSPMIRDQQFFQLDDGPLPGGHHFYAPKIVLSDPDVTKVYGRVSFTQMKAAREAAIDAVLSSIPSNTETTSPLMVPATNAPPQFPSSSPAASSPTPAPMPNPQAAAPAPATTNASPSPPAPTTNP